MGVGAEHFDHLIVNAQKEERRGPLSDEQSVLVTAGNLQREGGGD